MRAVAFAAAFALSFVASPMMAEAASRDRGESWPTGRGLPEGPDGPDEASASLSSAAVELARRVDLARRAAAHAEIAFGRAEADRRRHHRAYAAAVASSYDLGRGPSALGSLTGADGVDLVLYGADHPREHLTGGLDRAYDDYVAASTRAADAGEQARAARAAARALEAEARRAGLPDIEPAPDPAPTRDSASGARAAASVAAAQAASAAAVKAAAAATTEEKQEKETDPGTEGPHAPPHRRLQDGPGTHTPDPTSGRTPDPASPAPAPPAHAGGAPSALDLARSHLGETDRWGPAGPPAGFEARP